jgi:lipooligosaccharide transport system permease protein
MLSLLASRLAARSGRRLRDATAVTARNVTAVRRSSWWVLLSGFFEPLLYLLSIGIGVGALVKSFTLPDGRTIGYTAFVAPAMLAASAMNGALAESTFNFFFKMKFARLYDAILATPIRPFEIALGELLWSLVRGGVYAIAFLAIMVWLGLTTVGWALAAFPATVLVTFAFGGLGMAVSTCLRSWQDFDYVTVMQFAMFLFSSTFAPATAYPRGIRVLVELTPLYHGVELLRGTTTGMIGWSLIGHVAYLVLLAAIGLGVASRRMRKLLCE